MRSIVHLAVAIALLAVCYVALAAPHQSVSDAHHKQLEHAATPQVNNHHEHAPVPTDRIAVRLTRDVSKDEAVALAKDVGCEFVRFVHERHDTVLLRVPATAATVATVRQELLRNTELVRWAHHLVAHHRARRNVTVPQCSSTSSDADPLWSDQWHLKATENNGINACGAWTLHVSENVTITGKGVVVSIVDDGLQVTHPDFAGRVNLDLSYDFNYKKPDPSPASYDAHGTAAAGVAAAGLGDSVCGIGAAYGATLSGIKLIAKDTTDEDEALGLGFKPQNISIYSSSWGPTDDGRRLEGPGPQLIEKFHDGVVNGRQGLGVLFVWAGGNGRARGDNCNYDGYANSRYTLTISAIDHGGAQPYYSEDCSMLLAAAPSSGSDSKYRISTTDLIGRDGDTAYDCMSTFGGTSASAPLAAGVFALCLEANPLLTWRDVIAITIMTSTHDTIGSSDKTENSAGYEVSHQFGYGLMDAKLAVETALHWPSGKGDSHPFASPLKDASGFPASFTHDTEIVVSGSADVNKLIPDGTTTGGAITIIGSSIRVNASDDFIVESVEIYLWAAAGHRGDLVVNLFSPNPAKNGNPFYSKLASTREDDNPNYVGWRFGSIRHFGEKAQGDWRLEISDGRPNGVGGTFERWSIFLYGHHSSQ